MSDTTKPGVKAKGKAKRTRGTGGAAGRKKKAAADANKIVLDMSVTDFVGAMALGRLKDDRNVLVLYNRAGLTNSEFLAAQQHVMNKTEVSDKEGLAISRASKDFVVKMSERNAAGVHTRLASASSAEKKTVLKGVKPSQFAAQFPDSVEAMSPEAKEEVMNGGDRTAFVVPIFSPYVWFSSELRDEKVPLPACCEDLPENSFVRTSMEDFTWAKTERAPNTFLAQGACVDMWVRTNKPGAAVPVFAEDVFCTDYITSLLIRHAAVEEIQFNVDLTRPWLIEYIMLFVKTDNWPELMRCCKQMEMAFCCWYYRNRACSDVSVYLSKEAYKSGEEPTLRLERPPEEFIRSHPNLRHMSDAYSAAKTEVVLIENPAFAYIARDLDGEEAKKAEAEALLLQCVKGVGTLIAKQQEQEYMQPQ